MGVDLTPQFSISPDILIKIDFSKPITNLSKTLVNKLKNKKIK